MLYVKRKEKDYGKRVGKNYNPADIEQRTYDKWIAKKYFHAEVDRDKKPFTIVMPPKYHRTASYGTCPG